jgi:hypothetical protein
MFSCVRRHLSYANLVATLALIFAMGGTAVAAKRYLISSTGQISPKVLKKLKGATGRTGATGPAGSPGSAGPAGSAGGEGPRGPSNGYSAFKVSVGALSTEDTIGSLAVPAGSYIVTAKLRIINNGTERGDLACRLLNDVNSDEDESQVTTEKIGSEPFKGRAVLALETASKLATAGHWIVTCNGSATEEGKDLEIDAVQVATLTRGGA